MAGSFWRLLLGEEGFHGADFPLQIYTFWVFPTKKRFFKENGLLRDPPPRSYEDKSSFCALAKQAPSDTPTTFAPYERKKIRNRPWVSSRERKSFASVCFEPRFPGCYAKEINEKKINETREIAVCGFPFCGCTFRIGTVIKFGKKGNIWPCLTSVIFNARSCDIWTFILPSFSHFTCGCLQ